MGQEKEEVEKGGREGKETEGQTECQRTELEIMPCPVNKLKVTVMLYEVTRA